MLKSQKWKKQMMRKVWVLPNKKKWSAIAVDVKWKKKNKENYKKSGMLSMNKF